MQDYPPGGRPAEQKQQRPLLERLTALIAPEPENRAELHALLHEAYTRNDIAGDARLTTEAVFQVTHLAYRHFTAPLCPIDVVYFPK